MQVVVDLEVGQALQVPMEAHEAVPLVQEELLLANGDPLLVVEGLPEDPEELDELPVDPEELEGLPVDPEELEELPVDPVELEELEEGLVVVEELLLLPRLLLLLLLLLLLRLLSQRLSVYLYGLEGC